jgi:hypothetical protein
MVESQGTNPGADPQAEPTGQDGDRLDRRPDAPVAWPAWARLIVSLLLIFHLAALVAFESAGLPWYSELEEELASYFYGYVGLINQDYTHRYFAPEPDTEVPELIARLTFDDGRPDLELKYPDPGGISRIRFLRQIALVWHLTREDFPEEPGGELVLARAFARHLCNRHPGTVSVALSVRMHEMFPVAQARETVRRGEPLVLDSADLNGLEEPIGEFSCLDR